MTTLLHMHHRLSISHDNCCLATRSVELTERLTHVWICGTFHHIVWWHSCPKWVLTATEIWRKAVMPL